MKKRWPDIPDIIDPAVFGEMLEATAPLAPPSRLRDRVLARVGANCETLGTVRSEDTPWHVLSPGVAFKLLWFDKHARIKSFLLHAAAGSRFPRHSHRGSEECLVLEGECVIGAIRLRAGDFHSASMHTVHDDAYTENGFLMYLRTHIDDHPDIRPGGMARLCGGTAVASGK